MRALILYASRYGQTEKVCLRIADRLRDANFEVHAMPVDRVPRNLQVHAFDRVVIAGSVYFGKHAKKLEKFVVNHRENLAKTRTAFVSVSGAAGNPAEREEAVEAARVFTQRTGWTPDRTELVAGGSPYTRYGFFTKRILLWRMKQLGRVVDPRRDYEFTDWDAVDRFASQLAGDAVAEQTPELALL